MEKLYVPLEGCKERLNGRSLNSMRVKQLREKAISPESFTQLKTNPYLEIWDLDYYSTSDEEDNDSGKESEDDDTGDSADSEDDSFDEDGQPKPKAKVASSDTDATASTPLIESPTAPEPNLVPPTEKTNEIKEPKPGRGI